MMNSDQDLALQRYGEGRILAMRVNRYSWWTHWRELAEYFLPRRYRWLITPNMQSRGSPINQHILDSTGVICARNLASGIMSGKTSPSRPWFKLKVGRLDSTTTSPTSLWLAECERIMSLVFHESNFYNAMATFYYDLVVFGTAVVLIFEDFKNVINCINPCAGEFYVDINGQYRPATLGREFTMTIAAVVDEFGEENVSPDVLQAYRLPDGSGRSREIIVAHMLEPNDDGKARQFGFSEDFAYREYFWQWGGSATPQQSSPRALLRKKGYYELPGAITRWDLVSNDPYGRSVAMDALGDQKQLQLETRRKAQAIDKMVNPPLVADMQLKNAPASLLPGGVTYVSNFSASGKPGFATVYDTKFPVNEITEDLAEVRERLKKTFFNDLFQPLSQYETRSNITVVEVDQRKAESLIMLGPVFERIDNEGLAPIIERVFAMCARAGILPPPPQEIAGAPMEIEFVSLLNSAQQAAAATSIDRLAAFAGQFAGVDPAALDNLDVDYAINKYSSLLNNDPKLIRSPEELDAMRQRRMQQQAAQQQAELAEKMAAGAKTLSEADVGGGQNALQALGGQA